MQGLPFNSSTPVLRLTRYVVVKCCLEDNVPKYRGTLNVNIVNDRKFLIYH